MRRVCAEGMRRALFVFRFSGQIEEEGVCAGVCAVYIYRFPDTFFFNIHGVGAGVCAVYIYIYIFISTTVPLRHEVKCLWGIEGFSVPESLDSRFEIPKGLGLWI